MGGRTTRKRGAPIVNAAALHAGTVRKGRNGQWWLAKQKQWVSLEQPKKQGKRRPRKANKRMLAWAARHGMIKVFYNNPESCDCLRTKRKACLRMPTPLEGWKLSHKLRPNSPAITYSHVDEYIGPIETMNLMHKLMEAQFKTYKKLGIVPEYEFQVKTMMEKYKGWGRL